MRLYNQVQSVIAQIKCERHWTSQIFSFKINKPDLFRLVSETFHLITKPSDDYIFKADHHIYEIQLIQKPHDSHRSFMIRALHDLIDQRVQTLFSSIINDWEEDNTVEAITFKKSIGRSLDTVLKKNTSMNICRILFIVESIIHPTFHNNPRPTVMIYSQENSKTHQMTLMMVGQLAYIENIFDDLARVPSCRFLNMTTEAQKKYYAQEIEWLKAHPYSFNPSADAWINKIKSKL